MATAVIMPQVGQDIETATIVDWIKKENDPIQKGDVIATVESDKATFDVEAYESGVLIKILYKEGDEVRVLTPIAYIGQPGEKVVAEIENLSKNYGSKEVLKDIDLLLERDSKTAFVGQNGQGKTTLAKIMVGEIPFEGHVKLGHNVQIGYFAQNQAEYLDGNKTVLDTMIDSANEKNRSKVRDILGSFLFSGEDVDKYVKVLSGGERNRLALAKMRESGRSR